jgi:hypothetical protein
MDNLEDDYEYKEKENKRCLTDEEKKLFKLQEEQRKKDLKDVLNIPAGRRLIWSLMMDECLVFTNIYNPNSSHHFLAYHEGRRAIGMKFLKRCNEIDNNLVLKMLNESETTKINNLKKIKE